MTSTQPTTRTLLRTRQFMADVEAQRQARAQALIARTDELSAQIDEAMAQTPRLRKMKLIDTAQEAIAAHIQAAGLSHSGSK